MENVGKTINKKIFDDLLINFKFEETKELLKNKKGKYFKLIKLQDENREIIYKIIDKMDDAIMDDIFNGSQKILNEGEYKPIFLCDIISYGTNFIKRINNVDFNDWYYFGNVHFTEVVFENRLSFSRSFFCNSLMIVLSIFNHTVNFNDVTFLNEVTFDKTRFEKDTIFNNSIFKQKTSFFSTQFNNIFLNDVIFEKKVNFAHAKISNIFNFKVKKIGEYINFCAHEFGNIFVSNYEVFFEDNNLSKKPKKLLPHEYNKSNEILDTIKKYKEVSITNLSNLKKVCGKNSDFDEENIFYYWYKVYKRKNRSFFPKFIEWFVFDFTSGYFTKPINVFRSIFIIIIFSFFMYLIPCIFIRNNTFGQLKIYDKCISDNFYNGNFKEKAEVVRDIVYFDLITFTTIGYGDIYPTGWLKLYAGFEGLLGVIFISMFVVTISKRALW